LRFLPGLNLWVQFLQCSKQCSTCFWGLCETDSQKSGRGREEQCGDCQAHGVSIWRHVASLYCLDGEAWMARWSYLVCNNLLRSMS
jgi:hypothetical protein